MTTICIFVGVGALNDEYITPLAATAIAEAKGSGNLVERRMPAECAMALELIAEGKTYDEISGVTGLNYSALVNLKARHPETIEKRRKMLAIDGFEMAEGLRMLVMKKLKLLAADDSQLGKVNLKDLVIPFAIAQDKGFAALGENVTRIEHTHKKMSIEEAKRMIEDAKNDMKSNSLLVNVTPVSE